VTGCAETAAWGHPPGGGRHVVARVREISLAAAASEQRSTGRRDAIPNRPRPLGPSEAHQLAASKGPGSVVKP
jgi:hypothetical protein